MLVSVAARAADVLGVRLDRWLRRRDLRVLCVGERFLLVGDDLVLLVGDDRGLLAIHGVRVLEKYIHRLCVYVGLRQFFLS